MVNRNGRKKASGSAEADIASGTGVVYSGAGTGVTAEAARKKAALQQPQPHTQDDVQLSGAQVGEAGGSTARELSYAEVASRDLPANSTNSTSSSTSSSTRSSDAKDSATEDSDVDRTQSNTTQMPTAKPVPAPAPADRPMKHSSLHETKHPEAVSRMDDGGGVTPTPTPSPISVVRALGTVGVTGVIPNPADRARISLHHRAAAAGSATGASTEPPIAGDPPLGSMFNYRHISWSAPWLTEDGKSYTFSIRAAITTCFMLAYIPWGLWLCWMRLVATACIAVGILVLPSGLSWFLFHQVVMKLLPLFGFRVKISASDREALRSAQLLACNHGTGLDVLPLLNVLPVSVVLDRDFFEASAIIRVFLNLVGAIPISKGTTEQERDTTRRRIVRAVKESHRPLLWFPEGWDTNCRKGLLTYNQYLFSIGVPVVPLAMRATPAFPHACPGMLGSSALRELLWLFFFPWTTYEIHAMPAQSIEPSESATQFAKRVQRLTAESLDVAATEWRTRDALAWRKLVMHGVPTDQFQPW